MHIEPWVEPRIKAINPFYCKYLQILVSSHDSET